MLSTEETCAAKADFIGERGAQDGEQDVKGNQKTDLPRGPQSRVFKMQTG